MTVPYANRDAKRRSERPERKWYASVRWQALRLEIIERDGGLCQQTGEVLVGGRKAPNSMVVDHIKPHRGDPDLFWDPGNLQLVSKAWHDSEKQRRDRAC